MPARKKRTTLLLLSGGLDSTVCLFKLLSETDDDVHTFYINIKNNRHKAWCEEQALKHIIPIAQKVRKFEHHEGTKFDMAGSGNGVQSLMWMLAAGMQLNNIDRPRRRLCIGYTKGDSIYEYGDITEDWKYMWSQVGFEKRVPPLYMPLKNQPKSRSIGYLESRHPEVIEYLWTCENPDLVHSTDFSGYKPCGKCHPCERRSEWVQ